MSSLGRYTLVRPIGRGGMAEIWKAKITGPSGFVKFLALKTILPDIAEDRMFVSMFVDEAKLEASLVHPNVIQVFDFGEVDGRLFLAMEYIAGANVDRLLNRLAKAGQQLPAEIAIFIALEAARGLGYAHTKKDANGQPLGIVHRDISPQNLLVSATGEVKIGDFGIARAASAVPRTAAGQVRGKLAYMSPEQISGRSLDARSDLFSLGVVLYEMVTGERLFGGKGSDEVADKIRRFDPMAHVDMSRVPDEIRDVMLVVLQHDPDDRYRHAAQLETDLAKRLDPEAHARARRELGALVTRLFDDGIAADAQDETDEHPLPHDTRSRRPGSGVDRSQLETVVEGTPGPPQRVTAEGTPPITTVPPTRTVRRLRRRLAIATIAIAVIAFAAIAIWWTTRPAVTSGPTRGGTLRIAMGFDAERFDLFSIELSRTRMALDEVVEPLLRLSPDGEFEPWLLERTELTDGAHRVVLHLRRDVMFHDHPCLPGGRGRPATAEDVVYSLAKHIEHGDVALPIIGIDAARRGDLHALGITATDPLTVTIRLDSPAPFYQSQIGSVKLVPHELEGCEDLRKLQQPVGTGPFRFTAPPRGARMSLVRAPSYWRRGPDGEALPYLDGVEMQPIDDMRDVIARLGRGELEIAMPGWEDWPAVVDLSGPLPRMTPAYANLGLSAATHTSRNRVALFGLYLTRKEGTLSDPTVRRAIAVGIDRAKLIGVSDRKFVGPNGRFLEPRMLGYDATVEPLGYEPAAARELLSRAGHPDGKGLAPLAIGTIRDKQVGDALAVQLRRLGIEVDLRSIAPARAFEAIDSGTLDALLIMDLWQMYAGEVVDLVNEMERIRDSAGLRALHVRLSTTPERTDRAPIYKEIEQRLLVELPFIPLAWGDVSRPASVFIVGPRVHGFHDRVTGYGRLDNLVGVSLE